MNVSVFSAGATWLVRITKSSPVAVSKQDFLGMETKILFSLL